MTAIHSLADLAIAAALTVPWNTSKQLSVLSDRDKTGAPSCCLTVQLLKGMTKTACS